jgi:hypothetical protein
LSKKGKKEFTAQYLPYRLCRHPIFVGYDPVVLCFVKSFSSHSSYPQMLLRGSKNCLRSPQRRQDRKEGIIFDLPREVPGTNQKFSAFQAFLWPQAWVVWRIGLLI